MQSNSNPIGSLSVADVVSGGCLVSLLSAWTMYSQDYCSSLVRHLVALIATDLRIGRRADLPLLGSFVCSESLTRAGDSSLAVGERSVRFHTSVELIELVRLYRSNIF